MTDAQDAPREASVELFTEFVTRFSRGLQERIDTEVGVTPATAVTVDRNSPNGDLAGGALVGRTVWTADNVEHSGCFLWCGSLGSLVGGGEKGPADLSEPEIETLDQSLRLNIEEGGEEDLGVEWSPLEFVATEGLPEILREAGASATASASRIVMHLGDAELAFLFLEAPVSADADAVVAEGSPEESSDADADREAPAASGPEDPEPADGEFLEHLLDLRLPLTIRLGSAQMNLEDLLRLAPGSVVELEQRESEPLEVLANGRTVARGEVVVIDDRFGLRITEVGAREERIRATL